MLESTKSHQIPPPDAAEGADETREGQALCVYAESALSVRGRRGLVIGAADAGLSERLIELGARSVHLFDPFASRADAALRGESARGLRSGVSVRVLDERALDFRDGAFDFALISELSDVPSPSAVLAQVRRILERSGALLVRTKNAADGGIEYADLFDLISLEFPYVAMVGEVPFSGVAFAELGAEAPEVTVDSQLAEATAPTAYLALASHEPRTLEGYAIIQLPAPVEEELPPPEPPRSPAADVDLARLARLAREQAERVTELEAARIADREADREVAREAIREALKAATVRELEDAKAMARLTGEIYALREELDREGEKGMRLAMELEKSQRRIEDEKKAAETRIGEAMQASQEASVALQVRLATELEEKLRATHIDMASRLEETEAQLLGQDAQVVRLSRDLIDAKKRLDIPHVSAKVAEDLAARLAHAERRFAGIEGELGMLAGEHVVEISSLEAQLVDRARMVKAQDLELVRRATLVEDLLSALEDAQVGAAVTLSEGASEGASEARAPGASADPRPSGPTEDARVAEMKIRLDEMALEAARREGELEAREWRIKELHLERDLAVDEAAKAAAALADAARELSVEADPPSLPPDVARLSDELHALRQALVQEHAARVAAESGEALASARQELERQTRRIAELEGSRGARS